jgi:hypothetical protein
VPVSVQLLRVQMAELAEEINVLRSVHSNDQTIISNHAHRGEELAVQYNRVRRYRLG